MEALAGPLGFAALVLLHGVPLAVGAMAFPGRTAALTLARAVTFWAALEVAVATALGELGALRLWPCLATTLLACVGVALLRRTRWARPASPRWWPRRWPERLFVGVLLAIVVLVCARGLVRPPLEWDSLTYHLTRPAHWVREGSLAHVPLPDAMDNYNHFPWNGEVLFATVLLASHDDTFVGLANLPFLALLFAAVLAIGKELGARPRDRRLLALVVATAPVLLGQAHTAHVELQIAAEIAAGTLFVVRAVRRRTALDLAFAGAALGLAVGTKLTALVPAAFLALVPFVTLVRTRSLWPAGGAAVLALAALAGPRYLLNLAETGNPLYPIALRVPGFALRGSPFDERAQAAPPAVAGTDLDAWASLLPWHSGNANAAGFGPQLVVLLPLALLFVLRPRRAGERWIALAILVTGLVPLLGYFTSQVETAVRLRRGFAGDTPRYLAALLPLFAAGALGGAGVLASRGALWALRGILLLLLVGNLVTQELAFLRPLVELGCGAVAVLVLATLARGKPFLTVAALLAGGVSSWPLRELREAVRIPYWEWQGARVAGSLPPMTSAWKLCDGPTPRTIGYAVGRTAGSGFWFAYPLFGSRLQNRVTFVVPDRVGAYDPRTDAGKLGDRADHTAWRANLRSERIDLLVLQYPLGPEHELVRTHASEFEVLDAGPVHAVLRPR